MVKKQHLFTVKSYVILWIMGEKPRLQKAAFFNLCIVPVNILYCKVEYQLYKIKHTIYSKTSNK